jgi:hypothetical protein
MFHDGFSRNSFLIDSKTAKNPHQNTYSAVTNMKKPWKNFFFFEFSK